MGRYGWRRNTNSQAQRTMKPTKMSRGTTVPAFTSEDTRSTIDITPTTEITPKDQKGSSKGVSGERATVVEVKRHVVISLPGSEKTTQDNKSKSRQDQEGSDRDSCDDHHLEEEMEDEARSKGPCEIHSQHSAYIEAHLEELLRKCNEFHQGQHSAYIEAHLEELQKKCNEFHQCTIELYNAENFHEVLAGEPLQLSNICGLMYPEGEEEFTTGNQSVKCSMSERDAIREDIGRHLTREMADKRKTDNTWWSLSLCVERNRTRSESTVDTVCRLTGTQTTLCDNPEVHKETEHFFNHEMEHLHCSCAAIRAQAQIPQEGGLSRALLPKELRIAVGGSILTLSILLFVLLAVFCVKYRKLKKRLGKHHTRDTRYQSDTGCHMHERITVYLEGFPAEGDNHSIQPGDNPLLEHTYTLPERVTIPEVVPSSSTSIFSRREGNPELLPTNVNAEPERLEHVEDGLVNPPIETGQDNPQGFSPLYINTPERTNSTEKNVVNSSGEAEQKPPKMCAPLYHNTPKRTDSGTEDVNLSGETEQEPPKMCTPLYLNTPERTDSAGDYDDIVNLSRETEQERHPERCTPLYCNTLERSNSVENNTIDPLSDMDSADYVDMRIIIAP